MSSPSPTPAPRSTAHRPRSTRLALLLAGPLSAVGTILAFPDTGWWPLAFVAWTPILAALPSLSPGRAFLAAWSTGAIALMGIFHWVSHTAQAMSGFSPGAAAATLAAYGLFYGLGWGLFGLAARVLMRKWGQTPFSRESKMVSVPISAVPISAVVAVPAAAVAMELLWPLLFPYHLSNVFWRVPVLVQGFDLTGPYGGTFVAAAVATALALAIREVAAGRRPSWRPGALALALLAVWAVYGAIRLPGVREAEAAADRVTLLMVQPDIVPAEKLAARSDGTLRRALMDRLWALTRSADLAGVDAVVWPEGALPFRFTPQNNDPWGLASREFLAEVGRTGVPLVAGTTSRPGARSRNTMLWVGPDGTEAGRYDKRRLLAFGEYMPGSSWVPGLKGKVREVADMEPGEGPVVFDLGGTRALASICYEAILPTFTREAVADTGAELILNGTNDGWFGDDDAPAQHLMDQAARAVELRLPLARSTMTGITAVLHASGDVAFETGVHERRADRVDIPVRAGVFSLYASVGDVFAWACVLAVAAVLVGGAIGQRRGKKSRSTTTG